MRQHLGATAALVVATRQYGYRSRSALEIINNFSRRYLPHTFPRQNCVCPQAVLSQVVGQEREQQQQQQQQQEEEEEKEEGCGANCPSQDQQTSSQEARQANSCKIGISQQHRSSSGSGSSHSQKL